MQDKSNHTHKKILIIDHDYNGLLSFRQILSQAGYQIMTAMDVRTAEKLMDVSRFDYIIMNLNDARNQSPDKYNEYVNQLKQIFLVNIRPFDK